MRRWKVEAGFWWVAMQVDEQGREIPGTAKRFPTHAEALAYADRKARTREVVLPRVGDTTRLVAHNGHPGGHPSGYRIVTKGPECYYAVEMWGPWGNMGIYEAKDIRPLALALLAHAEKEQS